MDTNIVYRHRLEINTAQQTLSLSATHKLLYVGILNGELFLWIQVNACEKRVVRTIRVVGTGCNTVNPDWKYVGTAATVVSGCALECHVYVEPLEEKTE